jgi:hypothetical protein
VHKYFLVFSYNSGLNEVRKNGSNGATKMKVEATILG